MRTNYGKWLIGRSEAVRDGMIVSIPHYAGGQQIQLDGQSFTSEIYKSENITELVLVTEGEGRFVLDGTPYLVMPGTLLIVQQGRSPGQYTIHCRVEAAKHYLTSTDDTMERIAERVGYKSETHFQHVFKKNTGITPGHYRVKLRGITTDRPKHKLENSIPKER